MKHAVLSRERLITILFVYMLALLASIAAIGSPSSPHSAGLKAPPNTKINGR